jgi:hypothetical protein
MTQRVNITVKKASEQHDLNVPLTTTPANIAAALGWEMVNSGVITSRNVTIDGTDALIGKLREGDWIIFEPEESTGWRS